MTSSNMQPKQVNEKLIENHKLKTVKQNINKDENEKHEVEVCAIFRNVKTYHHMIILIEKEAMIYKASHTRIQFTYLSWLRLD